VSSAVDTVDEQIQIATVENRIDDSRRASQYLTRGTFHGSGNTLVPVREWAA